MRMVGAIAAGLALGCAVLAQSGGRNGIPSREWPTYGHDAGGQRFSPRTQITPANAAQLEVAWVHHMRPQGSSLRFASSQVTPLVSGGTMYLATPYSRVVAVDPTTGGEIWAFRLPS